MCEISILWQNQSTIVVDKPWHLPTQAAPGIESLQSRLRDQLGRQDQYLEMPHRLDRGVGGVVVVALTRKSARLLSQQFESRKTVKRYIACVHGEIDTAYEGASWRDFLRKIPDEPRVEFCSSSDEGARLAETQIESIKLCNSHSLVKLRPITGRMHQLRIQCAIRGHAIIGDTIYANAQDEARSQAPSNEHTRSSEQLERRAGRIWLHAVSIGFHDPTTGKRTTVESMPTDFKTDNI